MPPKQRGKDSDYLRFRPYHAFTSPAAGPARNAWGTLLWRGVLLVGGVGLLAAVGLWVLNHR